MTGLYKTEKNKNMIRQAIFILMIVFLPWTAHSQVKDKRTKEKLTVPIVEVGGGMGLSSVAGNLASEEYRLTGQFGAGFTLPISKRNNIHTELLYTFQGFKYGSNTYIHKGDTISLETTEQRFNYFKLNVMDRYFLDKNRVFYVNGGVYVSYLAQARYQGSFYTDIAGTDDRLLNEIDNDNKDDFTTVDFGMVGGVGLRLGNKKYSNFIIEARAAYGLINIAKPLEGKSGNEKTLYGILKLGVDIPLKK
jgi:hypothetical protein